MRYLSRPSLAARCTRAFACLAVVGFTSTAAHADTLRVPKDFATIQEAVDAAVANDEILISKGTYAAFVIESKNDLTIRGKGKVIIEDSVPPTFQGGGVTPRSITINASNGITLQRLRFEDTAQDAVVVSASNEFLFTQLRFDNIGTHAVRMLASDDGMIFKARIQLTGDDAIQTDSCDRLTVDKCVINDAGNDGVALSTDAADGVSNNCTVMRSKILRPSDDGVDINGFGNLVEKVTVKDALEDGFEVDVDGTGSFNVFRNCRAIKPALSGFVLAGSANTVQDSRVIQAGDDAISLRGTGSQVVLNNKIRKPGFDGVYVLSGAENNSIIENKISAPQDDGIDLESDGNTLLGNKIGKAVANGLEVQSTGNTIRENKVKGSGEFDLSDTVGGNTYVDNVFKTSNLD